MIHYRTKDGDMLDRICWHHYGFESAVTAVLEANPGLADYGPVLPAGILIRLPDLSKPNETIDTVRLWD